MRKCPFCGTDNPDFINVCTNCGSNMGYITQQPNRERKLREKNKRKIIKKSQQQNIKTKPNQQINKQPTNNQSPNQPFNQPPNQPVNNQNFIPNQPPNQPIQNMQQKMGVTDIIKDAFLYPIHDYKNWLIVGILFLIMAVVMRLMSIGGAASIILAVVLIILFIFMLGLGIDVEKQSINGSNIIPNPNPVLNFKDGIKCIIVQFLYYLVPLIITVIVAFVTGVFDVIHRILLFQSTLTSITGFNGQVAAQAISPGLFRELVVSSLPTILIGFIFFVIFSFLLIIGQVRLAETGSIKEALNIGEVTHRIGEIGIGKLIAYVILGGICISIISMISAIFNVIPYVGMMISYFIFMSFIFLFSMRGNALLYKKG